MTRVLVIFLSLILLSVSSGINFTDIAKTGFLLEHAQYHSEKYGDSFLDFLSKHYGMDKYNHKDDTDEHHKLPFQQSHLCSCIMDIKDVNFHLVELLPPPIKEHKKVFFYKNLYASIATNDIFQPPQFA